MSIIAVSDALVFLGKAGSATDAERGLLGMLIPLAEGALKRFVGYESIEQATYTEFYPDADQLGVGDQDTLDIAGGRIVVGGQSDNSVIPLIQLPVRSIGSVYEDAAAFGGQGSSDFAAATLLTSGTDYYIDAQQSGLSWTGFLRRINSTWPRRRRTVKVTYTAGFTAAELDGTATAGINAQALKFAAILAVVGAFKTAQAYQGAATGGGGPLQSESISTSGHSVTYATQATALVSGMLTELPPEAQRLAQPFRRYRL